MSSVTKILVDNFDVQIILNKEEAQCLRDLLGSVEGYGKARKITDNLWELLGNMGIKEQDNNYFSRGAAVNKDY